MSECNKRNLKAAAACHYRQQQQQKQQQQLQRKQKPQAPCNPGIQIKGSWQSKLGAILLFTVLGIIGFVLAQASRYYKSPTTYGKPPRHRITRQKPIFLAFAGSSPLYVSIHPPPPSYLSMCHVAPGVELTVDEEEEEEST